jgi:hypothetical protein
MNPEEKKLLEETAAYAKETNELVKKMHKHIMWGSVMRIVYWAVIIGASVGAFYLIQPYIDSVKSLYEQAGDTQNSISNFLNF